MCIRDRHYLEPLAADLGRLHTRTGARVTLISGPGSNPRLASIDHLVDRVPWSLSTVATALSEADVAIGPLDDTAYARGKCAYKLLQYAATGLPMVASPVGANALALERFDGVAVAAGGDWTEALEAVITESAARREARGRQGIAAVAEHYSFEAWSPHWRAAVLGS